MYLLGCLACNVIWNASLDLNVSPPICDTLLPLTEAAYKSLGKSPWGIINSSGFFTTGGLSGFVGVKSSSGVSLISSTGPITLEKLIFAL